MTNLGWPELSVIALAVVVLFGWKRLPDMARSLGRSARIFKAEVDQLQASSTTDARTGAPDGAGLGAVAGADARAAAAEADVRAAAAELEVLRLRAEVEQRRHAGASH